MSLIQSLGTCLHLQRERQNSLLQASRSLAQVCAKQEHAFLFTGRHIGVEFLS